MSSDQSLKTLYELFEKLQGRAKARQTVAVLVENVIGDLQDEGQVISEENIAKGLAKCTFDFLQATKSDVA